MNTILVFVSTVDGKITKWGDPAVRTWSSKNDQEYFIKIWNESRLIVMGSTTYNADRMKSSIDHHYVVMTRNPLKYRDLEVPDHLEFTDESPQALVARFMKMGYERMLVVGGPHVATSFLKEQLIDELWLTIEPRIFGTGGNLVTEEKLDIDLQLIEHEKVNSRGTLITKYKVLKS